MSEYLGTSPHSPHPIQHYWSIQCPIVQERPTAIYITPILILPLRSMLDLRSNHNFQLIESPQLITSIHNQTTWNYPCSPYSV